MPYEYWVEIIANAYNLRVVDSHALNESTDVLEYWASDNRSNSALVIIDDTRSTACPARTLMLQSDGERV